jgi:hypothetical protein
MVLGNSFRSGETVRLKQEAKLREGYNPYTGDKEGVRIIAPRRGDGAAYEAGSVYASPWGEVKLYQDSLVVIDEPVYNKHVEAYKKENARIKKLTEDMVSAGDEVFTHYFGKEAFNFLKDTGATRWAPEVRAALVKRRLDVDHLDNLLKYNGTPSYLDVINPKTEQFQLGMLKLANVIRYSTFVFDKASDAALPDNPNETPNLFAAPPAPTT